MAFVWNSRVRFVDTDASGRIHYTAMLKHFEAAEQEMFRAAGLSYADPHSREYGFPRVHVECDYTGYVTTDDVLAIAVTVDRIGNASFTLGFDATVEGRPVAHGNIVIVCVGWKTRRAQPLPEGFVAILKKAAAASA